MSAHVDFKSSILLRHGIAGGNDTADGNWLRQAIQPSGGRIKWLDRGGLPKGRGRTRRCPGRVGPVIDSARWRSDDLVIYADFSSLLVI